jgi:formimidoylglutamate deiminase
MTNNGSSPAPQARSAVWAPHALLPGGWATDVLLVWDAQGILQQVQAGLAPELALALAQGGCQLAGPLLPGMPNLHSHAFQRAFAGLTEYRAEAADSFWSWRKQMYRFAAHISPEQVEAIATWLYVEMLEAGYTSVCEFHYLHHDPQGVAYAEPAAMALALMRAARRTGIGLTLLPVLYQNSGFGGLPPSAGQRRFLHRTEALLELLQRLQAPAQAQNAQLGLALHSLRAVPPQALQAAVTGLDAIDAGAPLHIHIAEQTQEVDDCLAWSGQRPVQWLLDHVALGPRWCLVHATHMTPAEARAAAHSGAVVGLCPSTEANLGDGVFDMPSWQAAGGRWGIGSDSHVMVNAAEELMLLEYSQRLALRQRNVLATPAQPQLASAMTLAAVAGGAQASGRAIGGLAPGQQADFVVLDAEHLALQGLCPADMLAAHVFASQRRSALAQTWVAGRPRVLAQRHPLHAEAAAAFVAVRRALLAL